MRTRDETKSQAIFNIALEMIVEEGFKGLSMQKLAKKANVSPATIYIYFKDREDLLNRLYLEIFNSSNHAALAGFNPEANFKPGMQILWANRYNYFIAHPLHFLFLEQFINSPLVLAVSAGEDGAYRKQMKSFYKNAVNKKEVKDLPIEIYWSLAFAPLYQLIKFSLRAGNNPAHLKSINQQKVTQCLDLVLASLQV